MALRQMRWRTRVKVVRLAHRASRLPMDRIAFLSYDELRQDPQAATRWAAHLLDAEALVLSPRAARPAPSSPAQGELAAGTAHRLYSARAWRRAREAQIRAGLLGPGGWRQPDDCGASGSAPTG